MTIVATTILPRDADNTITLETNYNDLNLKATTLAEDLVAFVEAAISDVDTAATAIDGTMRMTLAATKEQADIVATSASLVLPNRVNTIGVMGAAGSGVGICPIANLPAGFTALPGYTEPGHDNYGNYQFRDGSVMVYVPKYWYREGHVDNPTYAVYGVNSVDIKGLETFTSTAEANAAGYALERMFIDGGIELPGKFVDKFANSINSLGTGHVASSIAFGKPISTASVHNPIGNLTAVRTAYPANKTISGATQASPCALTITGHGYITGQRIAIASVVGMTQLNGQSAVVTVVDANTVTLGGIDSTTYTAYASGGTATTGANAYYAAILAAKARDGINGLVNPDSIFHCNARYIREGLARISRAHGQAATSATYCAWWKGSGVGFNNNPRGNNNNAFSDVDDIYNASTNPNGLRYTSDGYTGGNSALVGSGIPFAKTTHNGQASGIECQGNMYEVEIGLTCIAASKAISGVALTNPCQLTVVGHGKTTGTLMGIDSIVGTTQLNSRIYALTVIDADTISLDGVDATAYTPYVSGGSIATGTFYTPKLTTKLRDLTAGNTLATDAWGLTGVTAHSQPLPLPFSTNPADNSYTHRFGNGANQVFSGELAGDPWLISALGFPSSGLGSSAAGSALMGNDYYYHKFTNELCVISGVVWDSPSGAGVRAVGLHSSRGSSSSIVSFRAACNPVV